jgi:hypothetical protein
MLEQNGAVLKKTSQDLIDSNLLSTSSFRYDPLGTGIRSTQQIPTDFSKFENHTFFSSAEANVNIAFEKIINEYPFDGSKREVESFLDSLSGFEKWVFDNFPRNLGYLNFSGSAGSLATDGTYIIVNDYAGFLYPTLSKKRTGENVIDPKLKSITIELHVFSPTKNNRNQVICQKISGSQQGFTLALSQSASTTACNVIFAVTSGALVLSASAPIVKGQFNHIVATLDRHPGVNEIKLFVNEELVDESETVAELGIIEFPTSPFTIGSGTVHAGMHSSSPSVSFIPTETFSGSIDELRVFHNTRTIKEQRLYGRKSIFATPELKLYYKFNEPYGTIGRNELVIDSSGNSLHALISNYNSDLRLTGSLSSPMTSEKRSVNPVLFPASCDVQCFNTELLATASSYDTQNPNLITKLIPPHYFQEGQLFEAFLTEAGPIADSVEGSGPPGSAELGSAQLLTALLYVWARFFDEIKMMLDLFGSVIHVDYDKHGFTADQFLIFLSKYYGFEMPAFFVDSSIEQFIDAENISDTIGTSSTSLQYVQNQLWRRILTNVNEVIRSKGTLHSIKALLRSMGVDPDQDLRIREFGGPTFRNLENARESKKSITTFLNMSGTLGLATGTLNAQGISSVRPFLRSPFLSGSRSEPGYPQPKGTFVPITGRPSISNDPSDGLLTSGSWTYEATYSYPNLLTGSHAVTQSLVRFNVTGSLAGAAGSGGLITNLVAISGSGLILYVAPGYGGATYPTLTLQLSGSDVMNGRVWNVCFGRQRADEVNSFVSASYFLRAARQEFGTLIESYTTQSYFNESGSAAGTQNVFERISNTRNASGSFFTIGSQSINQVSSLFLNDSTITSQARISQFDGTVGQIRFWSKALSVDEWYEHVRNYRSVGVQDPLTHFNFVTTTTGSFERLRLDVSLEQSNTMSNADGTFLAFDFSQNNFHISGSGFENSVNVTRPQRIFYSQLSPKFDEAVSNNKIRIRSFQDYSNVQLQGGQIAPIYEIPRHEQPNDDVRFSLDFSIADALNDDIVKLFATFDQLDNALGNPELIFSPDYPMLDDLRDVYFNRLTEKVKLRQFFEFFKWFDSVLGISTFIEQLIPRKTRFLGTNFIVESHMLERPKMEYLFTDIYLGENNRHGLKGTILLQQFVALLKRF